MVGEYLQGQGRRPWARKLSRLTLLNLVMKVLERVAENFPQQMCIDHMHFGIMPGRSATDAIFIVNQLQEKVACRQQDTVHGLCRSGKGIRSRTKTCHLAGSSQARRLPRLLTERPTGHHGSGSPLRRVSYRTSLGKPASWSSSLNPSDSDINFLVGVFQQCLKSYWGRRRDDTLDLGHNSWWHMKYNFENFVVNYENAIEKVYISFMKRTLNISKYASNKILYGELARFPLLHNAWALGVKYCLCLCNGTKNVLLNQCFELNVEENHNWL